MYLGDKELVGDCDGCSGSWRSWGREGLGRARSLRTFGVGPGTVAARRRRCWMVSGHSGWQRPFPWPCCIAIAGTPKRGRPVQHRPSPARCAAQWQGASEGVAWTSWVDTIWSCCGEDMAESFSSSTSLGAHLWGSESLSFISCTICQLFPYAYFFALTLDTNDLKVLDKNSRFASRIVCPSSKLPSKCAQLT